jgi:hypothetical protein
MEEETIQLKRNELYKKVWETPIWKLAKDYGLSDSGLKKICKKLNVPTPPRGYWAKLQNGYKVTQLPLPKKRPNDPDIYTINKNLASENFTQDEELEQNYLPDGIDLSKPINVSEKLSSPHPFVKEIRSLSTNSKPDEYGLIRPLGKKYLGFRTSPENLGRALRVFDRILKWFADNGYEFIINEKSYSYDSEAYFLIYDEKIQIQIYERANRSDHVPTKKELERGIYWIPKWDYMPCGKLSLIINDWGYNGIRKKWTDTQTNSIEEMLNKFISSMFKIAYLKKQRTMQREEEKRLWQLEQERRAEEKRLREIEKQKLLDLKKQAEQWESARKLRKYIKAVQSRASQMELSPELIQAFEARVSWANKHADSLDPLKREIFFNIIDCNPSK